MSAYKVTEKLHYTLIDVAMCGFMLNLFGGRCPCRKSNPNIFTV